MKPRPLTIGKRIKRRLASPSATNGLRRYNNQEKKEKKKTTHLGDGKGNEFVANRIAKVELQPLEAAHNKATSHAVRGHSRAPAKMDSGQRRYGSRHGNVDANKCACAITHKQPNTHTLTHTHTHIERQLANALGKQQGAEPGAVGSQYRQRGVANTAAACQCQGLEPRRRGQSLKTGVSNLIARSRATSRGKSTTKGLVGSEAPDSRTIAAKAIAQVGPRCC